MLNVYKNYFYFINKYFKLKCNGYYNIVIIKIFYLILKYN